MSIIEVESLSKNYKVHSKKEGLKGALQGLIKRDYHYVEAVRQISFKVEEGEVIGLIGQNGAGKTTTMKMLSGLLYPSSGKAQVMGFIPWERKKGYLCKISLLMGQKGQLLWDIPAYDSLELYKDIYYLKEEQFKSSVKILSQMLEVEHLLHVPVRNLSLGERMKMEIIASVLHFPKVLFLDEPTIGLDITTQKKLRSFLAEQNKNNGTTMILTSHYMADIVSLCPRIVIINQGSIVFDDKINKIRHLFQEYKIIKVNFRELPDKIWVNKNKKNLKQQNNLQYIFQIKKGDEKLFIQDLLAFDPIDFSIEEQPIEDIIEKIYIGGKKDEVL